MKLLILSLVIATASAMDIFRRQACADTLPNCVDYGKSVCTDPTYAGWVTTNCQAFCGKCGGSGGGVSGGGLMIGGAGSGGCPKADIASCSTYGQTICTDSKYTSWVHDNCCHFCSGSSGGGGGGMVAHMTQSPGGGGVQPGGGGFQGSSSGCVYGGTKVYQQGQTWKDGCKYSCTCTDAQTGQYKCTDLCVTWNSLPPTCTMNPPAAGMCCKTPNCPSNVHLQYPPGYTPQ